MKHRPRRPERLPETPGLLEALYAELDWRLDRLAHQIAAPGTPWTTPAPTLPPALEAARAALRAPGDEAPE